MSKALDADYNLIESAFRKQKEYLKQWEENERYLKSKHPKNLVKQLRKKKKSSLFIPVIRNTALIIEAIFYTAFFSQGNPIEILKVDYDSEDFDLSDVNKVINHYYERAKPAKELSKAFLSSIFYGLGVVMTFWDSSRSKTVTRFIPITDFAIDSECSSIDDIEHVAYKYNESNRVILEKIDSGYYSASKKKELKKLLFDDSEEENHKRKKVEVLYKRTNKGYECKTFINSILVRKKNFKNLPYQFGYCFDKLPDINEDERASKNLAYGGTIVELLEEIQKEINEKRNLKNDMQNARANPSVFYGEDAGLKSSDLTFAYGRSIPVKDVDQIKERQAPSDVELNDDLQILSSDVTAAAGTNSILEGATSASDRRSKVALSAINSNSSMRIEKMIMLQSDTLTEHWAIAFVRSTIQNASDKDINKITGKEFPFGKKGQRKNIEFSLEINFGMTVDKEKRFNDLYNLLQMIASSKNINPKIVERITKEALNIRLGKDTNLNEVFKEIEEEMKKNQTNKEDVNTL